MFNLVWWQAVWTGLGVAPPGDTTGVICLVDEAVDYPTLIFKSLNIPDLVSEETSYPTLTFEKVHKC